MTATSPTDGVAAPPALAAFLRGIERRAAVLADLQSGRAERGMPALAAAMRAFRSHAAALPMADWPLRFWKLLGAVPTLRQADAAEGAWPAPLAHLRTLQPADRLALLLRIVAGLDEPLAAQVLQLSTEDYQQALARACPRDAAGRPDAAGWRALADAAQQCLRDLPPARLQALAQLRDAAIAGSTASPAAATLPAPDKAPARPRRGGARPALRTRLAGAVIAVVVLALIGTVFWDRLPWHRSRAATAAVGSDASLALGDTGPVQVEVLPPESDTASAPPLPADPPAPLPEPAIYDLDFYAWYAAGAPPPRIERGTPSAADLEAAETPAAAVAPAIAPAAATTTPPALTPAQLRARQTAWEALPAAAQARLRQVATAFAGLPIEQQHTLHAQFAEMDALERHGWLLGPELGAEFWALQPLLGYVPEAQRQALLGLLRSLPADQREHLALLSQRTPPQDRAALRRDLLAQGADSRGAWLKQRAAR
ncbi:hypothetical protein GGR71_002989 [Xanthomonas sp. F1]